MIDPLHLLQWCLASANIIRKKGLGKVGCCVSSAAIIMSVQIITEKNSVLLLQIILHAPFSDVVGIY